MLVWMIEKTGWVWNIEKKMGLRGKEETGGAECLRGRDWLEDWKRFGSGGLRKCRVGVMCKKCHLED